MNNKSYLMKLLDELKNIDSYPMPEPEYYDRKVEKMAEIIQALVTSIEVFQKHIEVLGRSKE